MAEGKKDDDKPKDGRRHDVTGDKNTGKTSKDLDPREYDPRKRDR